MPGRLKEVFICLDVRPKGLMCSAAPLHCLYALATHLERAAERKWYQTKEKAIERERERKLVLETKKCNKNSI
jgi:hypothetical protein